MIISSYASIKKWDILKFAIFGLIIGTIFGIFSQFKPVDAAANATNWRPGQIIDDSIFFNSNDMSADDVQVFLNQKNPTCDTWGTQTSEYGGGTRAQYGASKGFPAPYTCLKDYYENQTTRENNLQGRAVPTGALSAAQIIKKAADTYSISVRVLLVMIQKESPGPLVTDSWPYYSQYRNAMGYGCPDTAPCDPQYEGFANQVNNAARQFQIYKNNPNSYRHKSQQDNAVLYSPNSACGSSTVFIKTLATAGLYNYTPYQPNQAALSNLYGTGDGCSAYGNRNFWRLFSDWFGSVYSDDTASPHPDGTLISMDNSIYVVSNGSLRHVGGGSIFDSYRFSWGSVKPATSGDRSLSISNPINSVNPDRLYRTAAGVYSINTNDGGVSWFKQLVSYQSFTTLGYNWDDIMPVSDSELPQTTSPTVYTSNQHRNGDLISNQGKVYLLDHGTRRYVGGAVFNSHNWPWQIVMQATSDDLTLQEGERTLYQEGTILFDGSNLYVVKLPPTGYEIKQPIGPWECYALSFKYTMGDTLRVDVSQLPVTTGSRVTCS